MALTIWTLGHSSRTLPELIDVLATHGIQRIVDVRRFPGSRRHPHFSRAALASALTEASFQYHHAADLGGHRDPRPDSRHTALDEDGFRGYADHMESDVFTRAFTHLLRLGAEKPTAIMCAEAGWERCHRSLLCDRLKSEGVRVLHVRDATAAPVEHGYSSTARLVDGRLDYHAPVQGELPW